MVGLKVYERGVRQILVNGLVFACVISMFGQVYLYVQTMKKRIQKNVRPDRFDSPFYTFGGEGRTSIFSAGGLL